MTHYKAVQIKDDKILPCVHPTIGLEYKVGEWTEPLFPGSSLLCCGSLEHAQCWAKQYNEWLEDGTTGIFSCEVEIDPNPVFMCYGSSVTECIKEFWNKYSKADDIYKTALNQVHLIDDYDKRKYVFCKRIKLLEKVD